MVNLIWVLACRPFKRRQHRAFRRLHLGLIQRRRWSLLRMLGRSQTRAPAENQQIRQRISSQPVRAVQSRRSFARRKQPRHRRLARLGLHANSAHHVVARRPHFHRRLCNVHIRQFLELVIHARQLSLHVLGRLVRNIQKRSAVRRSASFLHFGVNRPRHHVTRRKLHALRIVLLHEAL